MPNFRGKTGFLHKRKQNKKKVNKNKPKKKEGLGSGEVARTKQKQTKQTNKKQNGKKNKEKKNKNTKNELCSYRSIFSVFFVLSQKKTIFHSLAQNARTPKTLYNEGFQQTKHPKTVQGHETAISGQKQFWNSSIIFVGPFLVFEQQKTKTHKIAEPPIFVSL